MRLLGAELRKLARPVVWGTTLSAVAFLVLLLLGGSANARSGVLSPGIRDCPGPTSACQLQLAQANASARASAQQEHAQELPGLVGEVAAGMMASLPGVIVVALLAGAHVGGEWSGRTIRTLLTHEGRRVRVLAAKWISLWLAAVAIMAVCWVTLAIAGPLLASLYHLPPTGASLLSGLGASGSQFGRAILVLGLFSLVGVAAATLTRNTVGTIAVVVGLMVVFLIFGGLPSLSRWSPATAVGAWMRFGFNGAYLPTNFWSRFERSGVHLSAVSGFLGMMITGAAAAAIAAWRIRADVT